MKKRILIIALALVCLLMLASCGCKHQWIGPDCTNPATCALCGKTDGAPIGHSWLVATCSAPKTCSVCGKTEGEPLEAAASDFTASASCATVKDLIDKNMGTMNPVYEYNAESQIFYISLTAPQGTAAALATNPDAVAATWETLKTSLAELTASAQTLFTTDGYPEVSCCIMLLNDANTDNVLLGLLDGQVVFDAMAD